MACVYGVGGDLMAIAPLRMASVFNGFKHASPVAYQFVL